MRLSEPVNSAVSYLLAHLREEAPTVEELAAHCHFSRFHFSRLFKAETGESPYAFTKRMRLEESAFRLKVEPGQRVTDVGCEYGYTASNYSSAFRQQFGQNPVQFRRKAWDASFGHPFCHLPQRQAAALLECSGGVRVQRLPDLFVVYERRLGNYHELDRAGQAFLQSRRPLCGKGSQFLVRSFDDPSITDPGGCLYDLCMTVPAGFGAPGVSRIPGGRYLVLPYRGPVWNIYAAYQALFNLWLPGSGCRINDQYSFDLYHRMNGPEDVVLDICLPLEDAG